MPCLACHILCEIYYFFSQYIQNTNMKLKSCCKLQLTAQAQHASYCDYCMQEDHKCEPLKHRVSSRPALVHEPNQSSLLFSFSCFFFKKMYKILQIITTILFPDSFSFQLNSWTTSANLYKLKEKKHFPGLEHPSHCYTHAHTPGGMWVTTL